MNAALKLEAEVRGGAGKGDSRELRRNNRIPAVIYGGDKEGLNISLPLKEVVLEYNKGHFTSKLVDIQIGKETIQVLPKEVQIHPVSDVPQHIDFIRVVEGAKIRVQVAVKFLNVDKSPGIKRGGVLNIVRRDVELFCELGSIPQKLEVDLAACKIGDTIHISHLTLPKGTTPTITDRDFTIATIVGRSADTDEDKAAEASADATAAAAPAAAAKGAAAPAAKGAPAKAAPKK